MIDLRSRSKLLSLGLATLVLGSAIVACTGDEASSTSSPDASTSDSDASDDDTPPTNDAGSGDGKDTGTDPETDASTSEDAGEQDLDAGDDDGGEAPDAATDEDAGSAAACNELTPTGTITATCTTTTVAAPTPPGEGGTLVAGNYNLVSVTAYRIGKGCTAGLFTKTDHGGHLVVTAVKSSFTASYVITAKTTDGIEKPTVARYEQTLTLKGANAGSPANVSNECPKGADGTVEYTSTTVPKVGTTLSFYAPYGKGTALYTWKKPLIVLP